MSFYQLPVEGEEPPETLRSLQDGARAVLVLLGRPERVDAMVQVGRERAAAAAATRAFVWDPDSALPAAVRDELRGGSSSNVEACYGLDGRVARRLRPGEARNRGDVERAFNTAYRQHAGGRP